MIRLNEARPLDTQRQIPWEKLSVYDEKAVRARFLLGGIGTGNISLDSRGHLCDYEIYNRPHKGLDMPYSFFAIRLAELDEASREKPDSTVCRILEAALQPPYDVSTGILPTLAAGVPRFRHSRMQSAYPFVKVDLIDDALPIEASLTAYTPFIPLDVDRSSLPAALLTWTIRNRGTRPLAVSLCASMTNPTCFQKQDVEGHLAFRQDGINTYVDHGAFRGLHFTQEDFRPDESEYMEAGLFTTADQVSARASWVGRWWDNLEDFWYDFASDGLLESVHDAAVRESLPDFSWLTGSLAVPFTLQPGESRDLTFWILWHRPNRQRSWVQEIGQPKPERAGCCSGSDCCDSENKQAQRLWRNDYARHGGPLELAERLSRDEQELREASRQFAAAFYSSTLPIDMLEVAANNITVLRSTTCFLIEGGHFYGFEGCINEKGCCAGNCSHVWNYAQTVAYLFPQLERSMRRTEFLVESDPDGRMNFRAYRDFDAPAWTAPPAADGQMGSVLRCWREWRLSGDRAFLDAVWPQIKRSMEFAKSNWDHDDDGVFEQQQHNTYDIEFYGPNPLTGAIYLAALRAYAELATVMAEPETAAAASAEADKSSRSLDRLCWNGEYYQQALEDRDAYRHQFGEGCLSDQLLGQTLAYLAGLGPMLPEDHLRSAAEAIWRYNNRPILYDHVNLRRTYALADEGGLILCTWPRGGRPKLPFVYCDEIWTGFEYQVATMFLYLGLHDEAIEIVRRIRKRQDGIRRSPWNEIECGNHYVRAMSSWGLIVASSGFQADVAAGQVTFDPIDLPSTTDPSAASQSPLPFRCFYSCGGGWGMYERIWENGAWTETIERA